MLHTISLSWEVKKIPKSAIEKIYTYLILFTHFFNISYLFLFIISYGISTARTPSEEQVFKNNI